MVQAAGGSSYSSNNFVNLSGLMAMPGTNIISTNFTAATFGQAATWNEPRRLLLGVRLTY